MEAWAHPVRLLAGARWAGEVRPGGFAVTPEEVRREARVAGAAVTERWHVPIELPAVIWEIGGATGRSLGFTLDLRRSWPARDDSGTPNRIATRRFDHSYLRRMTR